jgi:pyruvate dehydrogenase E2 component (dihydrolipoamide acetyltransferase)
MATEFIMPQLGLTMTEGTVSKWFKAVGDTVSVGDLLVEVETEKITNQLESTVDGTLLEILVPEGFAAPVQAVLAVIGRPGESPKLDAEVTAAAAAVTAETAAKVFQGVGTSDKPMSDDSRVKASPIAKKMARELNVDLSIVTGTGPGGRVVERDILDYAERTKFETPRLAAPISDKPSEPSSGVPITGMRKVIAERMSVSWQTSPHVNMTAEVDMSATVNLKQLLTSASGKKISYTEIIIKCAAQALTEFRELNASLTAGSIYYYESVNIGLAVALDSGLIVPVINDASKKTVVELHDMIEGLSLKARQGALSSEEILGGTFTVTNLGMFGVDHFTPIINQPESAILGVCRVIERPVVQEGAVVIRPMMNLCLSFDHRLVDGAVGAKFLARIRELLEQPLLLFI